MNDFEKMLCRWIGHSRSKSSARPKPDGGWVSRCRRCGIAMRRDPVTEKWAANEAEN